jgi:very-short-patch-repair endonuclease
MKTEIFTYLRSQHVDVDTSDNTVRWASFAHYIGLVTGKYGIKPADYGVKLECVIKKKGANYLTMEGVKQCCYGSRKIIAINLLNSFFKLGQPLILEAENYLIDKGIPCKNGYFRFINLIEFFGFSINKSITDRVNKISVHNKTKIQDHRTNNPSWYINVNGIGELAYRTRNPSLARFTESFNLCYVIIPPETEWLNKIKESIFGVEIIPQFKVGSYRIDIMLASQGKPLLAIEVDEGYHRGPTAQIRDTSRENSIKGVFPDLIFLRVPVYDKNLDSEQVINVITQIIEGRK